LDHDIVAGADRVFFSSSTRWARGNPSSVNRAGFAGGSNP
jgi:hypothetical protein